MTRAQCTCDILTYPKYQQVLLKKKKIYQQVLILNLTQEEAPHVQYKTIPFSLSFFGFRHGFSLVEFPCNLLETSIG